MRLTIPNILTLMRLLAIPVFVYLAISEREIMQLLAALLFGLAALTDWLDGYLARRLNQSSEFGKLADPFVDRLFVATGLIVLYLKISELVPLWALIIVIGRDIVILLGWLALRTKHVTMDVTYAGKTATAFLMTALFILLVAPLINTSVVTYIGLAAFYIGVVLSVTSGWRYVKEGMGMLRSASNVPGEH